METTTRRGFVGRLTGMLALAAAAPATLFRQRPAPPSLPPLEPLEAMEGPMLHTTIGDSAHFVAITAMTDAGKLQSRVDGAPWRMHPPMVVLMVERPRFGQPDKWVTIRAEAPSGTVRQDDWRVTP